VPSRLGLSRVCSDSVQQAANLGSHPTGTIGAKMIQANVEHNAVENLAGWAL
jgi:hypothetical protein